MIVRKCLGVLGKRLKEIFDKNRVKLLIRLVGVIVFAAYVIVPLIELITPILILTQNIYYMAINDLMYLDQFEISSWLDKTALEYSIYGVLIGSIAILISFYTVILIGSLKAISQLIKTVDEGK